MFIQLTNNLNYGHRGWNGKANILLLYYSLLYEVSSNPAIDLHFMFEFN